MTKPLTSHPAMEVDNEDLRLAEMAFRGLSQRRIAAELGTSQNAVMNRLKKQPVIDLITEFVEAARATAKRRVARHAGTAVAVLMEVAKDRAAPHAARVSAARSILDWGVPRETRTEISGPNGSAIQIQSVEDQVKAALAIRADADLGIPDDLDGDDGAGA